MKRTWVLLVCVILSLLVGNACRTGEVGDSYTEVLTMFQDPPAMYRGSPLWVWNDRVSETQIEEQLRDFRQKGIGGVFIHPRPGLITPYLSEEWLSLCRYAVQTAKDLDMKVWIYDENSYPSGFAGGHVPDQMPDSVRKSLVLDKAGSLPESFEQKPFLILKRTEEGFEDITVSTDEAAGQIGEFYIFHLDERKFHAWYGGFTYVDLMRREVTEKFLEVTLDAYKGVIGEEFGTTVPGVFQDEAHIGPTIPSALSWTPALFETFQGMMGYDLRLHLPSLFEDTGNWRRIRHDYYTVTHNLFIEGWARPYAEYCETHNLDFTGHYWEHEWPLPQYVPDSMAMASYSHMPGIDVLMNDYDTGPGAQFGNVRSVKEIRSVANQMGRERTLSETFGAGGWEMSFFDQKRIGDWEYALGVNFLNQHLSYISIKGARKRDHPLSFSYHEPWWQAYGILGDYFGRLSAAMSLGEQQNSVLVLEPTTTAWMYFSPAGGVGESRLEDLGNNFQDFVNRLESRQYEYDLGSESIVEEHGSVLEGKFVVGERAYPVVVLAPGMENLDSTTLSLLREFLQQGGRVLSWVDPPGFVDGRKSGEVKELAAAYTDGWIAAEGERGWDKLENLCPPVLDFKKSDNSGGWLFHHRRVLADAELVFLVNTHPENEVSGGFTARGDRSTRFHSCERWDPFTGDIESYLSRFVDGQLSVDFNIPPGGSLLLCLKAGKSGSADVPAETEMKIESEGKVSARLLSPNVLTLDYCDLTLGDATETDLYFYDAQLKIFQHHGLESNPWQRAVQFKTRILDQDDFAGDSGFTAEFRFEMADGVDLTNLRCVVERSELYTVYCNGTEIRPEEGAWWLDRDFGVFDIGKLAQAGKNRIRLKTNPFTIHTELEAVYLLGDFDLESRDKGFRMVPAERKSLGSWKEQGMPFYAGGVSYEKEYRIPESSSDGVRYFVQIGQYSGAVTEILVNGESAGFVAFHPLELDITDKLQDGPNRICVVVYGTLKNTLGPHHNNPVLGTAWPAHFQKGAEGGCPPGSEYSVLDYGLFEDFSVILRR